MGHWANQFETSAHCCLKSVTLFEIVFFQHIDWREVMKLMELSFYIMNNRLSKFKEVFCWHFFVCGLSWF